MRTHTYPATYRLSSLPPQTSLQSKISTPWRGEDAGRKGGSSPRLIGFADHSRTFVHRARLIRAAKGSQSSPNPTIVPAILPEEVGANCLAKWRQLPAHLKAFTLHAREQPAPDKGSHERRRKRHPPSAAALEDHECISISKPSQLALEISHLHPNHPSTLRSAARQAAPRPRSGGQTHARAPRGQRRRPQARPRSSTGCQGAP